jgi:hypothetical protein
MGVAEFYYLEGGLFFGFLVAAGLTVVSLNRPDYRVARRCAWAAAILFGSIAAVWGVTTTEPAWIRLPAVGIVGLIAAISLTEALRFIKSREFPSPPSAATAAQRGPTLEAINRSTIDATEAVIPGDLPFQFGKAENDSLINMRGVQVTKTEQGGWIITPGQSNIEFPEPPAEYAFLSTPGLRLELQTLAHTLHEIQAQYTAEARQAISDKKDTSPVFEKYNAIYQDKFADLSLALASAALKRIGTLSDVSRSAQSGGTFVYYKKFAGPTPAGDIAAFLDLLSVKLPN